MGSRRFWARTLIAIIVIGVISRVVHTGFVLIDKYLGDALYAAMIYALLRLWRPVGHVAVTALAVMAAIESFQLTMIPARLLESGNVLVRIFGRLLGTHFSVLDLAAYGVGIGCLYFMDRRAGIVRSGRG